MRHELIAESDPLEIEHSRNIMQLLAKADKLEEIVEKRIEPLPTSKLALDTERSPAFDVASYAHAQISNALGSLATFRRLVSVETSDTIEMTIGPYGEYALIRNSLDAAAVALWLLEPQNGTLRIRRRLLIQLDETKNGANFRESMGMPWKPWKEKKTARINEVASLAELEGWAPTGQRLPTTSAILKSIERHNPSSLMSWLAAWQLASGHAHSKNWAQVVSHVLEEIEGSRKGSSSTYKITASYTVAVSLLLSAVDLAEVAVSRYVSLAS